jgi:hypothetical protein
VPNIPTLTTRGASSIPTLGGIGGGQIPTSQLSGGLVSPPKKRKKKWYEGGLLDLISPGAAESIRSTVASTTKPLRPGLHVIGKIFSSASSTLVGFTAAYSKAMGETSAFGHDATHEGAPAWEEPWTWMKAIGAGFRDIPHSVSHDGTAMEKLTAKGTILGDADPHSFIGRHRDVIALSVATVTDPIMYLSVGATSVDKIRALRTLSEASFQSARQAERIMASGGSAYGRRFITYDEALTYVHAKNGRPFTLGDALAELRESSKLGKRMARRGRLTEFEAGRRVQLGLKPKVTAGERVGAFLPPRGGRGVRFAGGEIPGTPELGAYISRVIRGKLAGLYEDPSYKSLLFMIPNSILHHVGSDLLRANMMAEFTNYRRISQNLRAEAGETAANLMKPIQELGGLRIPKAEERIGLHNIEVPSQVVEPSARALRDRIERARVKWYGAGMKTGMKEHEIDKLWMKVAAEHDDPIEATAEFAFRMSTRTESRKFTERILNDSRFSEILTGRANIEEHLGWHLPGRMIFKFNGKKYAVPHEIYEALETMGNRSIIDHETSRLMSMLNWPQNKWKIYATVLNPAFHTMNTVGAIFNNALGMLFNPADYVAAVAAVTKDRLGTESPIMAAARERGALGKESFVQVEAASAAPSTELLPAGGAGAISKKQGKSPSLVQAIERKTQRGPTLSVSRLTETTGYGAKRLVARRARQATGVGLAATLNPLAAVAFAPEIATAGRAASSFIEDFVRLAPFMKASKDRDVAQLLHAYGPIGVGGMVHPTFTKHQQEVMYDIGADISNHFQFDYRDLTEVERRFAKTIFPFYTYFKKNFVLQLTEAIKQPRNIAGFNAFTTYMNEESPWSLPESFRRILPEYFEQLDAFAIPVPGFARDKMGIPKNQPVYLNPKLPFISLNLFPPLWDIFRDTGEPTNQKIMRIASPITGMIGPFAPTPVPGAKLLFEVMTNTQLGLARPVDYKKGNIADFKGSIRDAPGWVKYLPKPLLRFIGATETKDGKIKMSATAVYVVDQMSTPFINNLGSALSPSGGSVEEVGKARANAVSWLTGVRLMPVDMLKLHRAWGYRLVDMLEAQKAEASDRGQQWDPDEEGLLKDLRASMREIEYAYDAREGAIYGSP